jgi:Mn-dependent DtxR family transcriptional regulator
MVVSRGQIDKSRRLEPHTKKIVKLQHSAGHISQNQLARLFNVSVSTINKIIKGD